MKHLPLISIALVPLLANALTINDAMQTSIQTHPKIKMQKEDKLVQDKLLTRVKAGYLPSVDLSYTVGRELTKTPANLRKKAFLTRRQATVTVKQNLFSGFDTKYGVKQQQSIILSSTDKVKESANKLALETATAYIDILRNYKLLQIANENVAVHKKYLAQIKRSVDAGVGRSSDYTQTLARYRGAQSIAQLTKQNYLTSISSFERLYPKKVTFKDLQEPVANKLPAKNINFLINMALKYNPTIEVSQDDIKAAQSALKRSDAPYYPTADLKLESYWNKDVHGVGYNGTEGRDDGYNAPIDI